MLTPFANSARALAAGPLTWKTWTGLIVVPVIVMGLLTWALWSPEADHGTATAAVVNHDEPVTVNGQTIPLGRALAGNLTHDADSAYKWVLTDDADAAEGLDGGRYAAVVTIPSDFSARATSAATGKPLDARQAVLGIRTSAGAGVADPALSGRVAQATQQTLDQQVVQTYLDNIYVGFTTIHDQINQAADGAGQLAGGTVRLRTAAAQLAGGSAQLATGLSQAERDTAQLPALTRQLADGAEQVAQGNEKLAATVVPLADRVIAAIDALPSARDAAAEFQRLSDQCTGTPEFCQGLARAAARFATDAGTIDGAKATVRADAVQVRDSIQALAAGARKVANGNAALADRAVPLVRGIADAAGGARQLASGAGQLNDGAAKVDDGARQLATELDQGRDQVPSYTDAERAHLKTVAADPTAATVDSTPTGTLAITLFAALALWALALATYIVTRAVPDAVLTAREPTWRIIVRAAIPGATAAALAGLVITAIAAPVLRLGAAGTLGFLAVALLAAGAFVALNQAATAIFGRPGRLASLAVLVLGAATGILSTLPRPLYDIAGYLPTHGAVIALRGGPGLLSGVVELAVWLGIGTLASIVVTDRRRYLSTRQLRHGALLPATA